MRGGSAELVDSTTDPAFSVDRRGKILAWNRSAERLFGYKASEVIGRHCWEVVAGRDIYGNEHCHEHCQLRRMAMANTPINPCLLIYHDAAGTPLRAKVSMLVLGGSVRHEKLLVHVLSPGRADADPVRGWQHDSGNANSRLTAREREVLALLGNGESTGAIADRLGVSPATVRNHIQNLLGKLRVHSRLAAVSLGRRLGLIR